MLNDQALEKEYKNSILYDTDKFLKTVVSEQQNSLQTTLKLVIQLSSASHNST
jgi:hypothetical protein